MFHERYTLLDFSAVLNHCLNSGTDENQIELEDGKHCNTAHHGFGVFLHEYLLPILQDCSPRYLIAAHDSGTDYREFIAPDYKAKRKLKKLEHKNSAKHKEFELLSRWIKQTLASLGATQLKVDGVEADDILAYLCQGIQAPKRIYTVDADLMVLADETTQVFLKNCYVDPSEPDADYATSFILMMYDVIGKNFPKYVSLAKALLGDTSDEFTGIKGFGKSCFRSMVEEIDEDGLDEVLEALRSKDFTAFKEARAWYEQKDIKVPRWLKLVTENLPDLRKGWALASLHPELCEEPFQKKIPKIEWYKRVPSAGLLSSVLSSAGYADLLPEFGSFLPKTFVVTADNYSLELLDKFAEDVKNSPTVSFDYETWDDQYEIFKQASTTGSYVDVPRSRISGVSFSYGMHQQHNFYLTVDHCNSANLPQEILLEFFNRIPEEATLVAHNAFFEIAVTLKQLGHTLENVHDTMIMSQYCNENEPSGLKFLSKQYLNYKQATYKETLEQAGLENATMRDLSVEQVTKYGVDDSIVTGALYDLMKLRMMCEKSWSFYAENEPLTANVLAESRIKGARIDWDKLAKIEASDRKAVDENTTRLRELLQEHCSKLNTENAEHLISIEEPAWKLQAKLKYEAMDEKQLDKAIASQSSISTEGSKVARLVAAYVKTQRDAVFTNGVYQKFEEVAVESNFVPTVAGLNKIVAHLGFATSIESISNKGIREWLRINSPFDLEGEGAKLTPEQNKFHKLLAAANTTLKRREGEAYESLMDFCKKEDPTPAKTAKRGTELNLNSPKQSQFLIYVMLGAKVRNHTRPQPGSFRQVNKLNGAPATDEIAIKTALAEDFSEDAWQAEALKCLLAAKSALTRISLYHTPYKMWRHPDDDLIYPSIRNFGTVTGRPSGSAPNILQVSKHQEEAVMRSIYLPRHDDHCVVAIDFAGQELRLLASISEDQNMLSAYIGAANAEKFLEAKRSGELLQWTKEEVQSLDDLKDIHSQSGAGMSSIFGLPKMSYESFVEALHDETHPHHVGANKIRKRPAKTTNFLMSYGGTPPALAQKLIIKLATAEKMMDATDKVYPNIAKWQEKSAAFARKHGYTVTAYGKRRHANNDLFSKQGGVRSRIERQVANAEIQGTAADILKVVLSESWRKRVWQETGATMLAPVYDELVASVPYDQVVSYIKKITEIMNLTPPNLPVPMVADVSVGHNWQAQIELGSDPTEAEITEVVEKLKRLGAA